MKRWLAIALLAVALSLSAEPLGIMVPAYFYPTPGGLWDSLSNVAVRVPLVAIPNPNNGPDTSQNPDYVAAVNAVRSAGGKVIGYVYTSYTARPLAQVQADIDRHLAFYAADGFFIDEMTDDALTNHLDYYAAIFQYVKAKGAQFTVVGNPGTNTEEDYFTRPTADALVIFEDNTGYAGFTPSGWVTNHPARQFVHLPYNVTNATTMSNYVSLAVARNAGWIYVTNDKGANPWDTLPAYWESEISLVQSINQSAPSTRLALTGMTNRIPSLQISGAPGMYEVQATSNFATWFQVGTVNLSVAETNFTDATATNRRASFYRTRQ